MPQKDVSAWDVISQQLPQWWADPQTKDLRESIQSVVPTTPLDLGMMMLGGPTGGMAKKVGAGLIAAGTGEAEAAGLGNLRKLFALGAEALGRAPTREEMIELALKSNAWLKSQVGRGQTKAQSMLQTMASVPTEEGALSVASRIQKPTPEQLSKAFDAGFTQVGSRIVPTGNVAVRSEKAITPGMHLAPAGNEHQIRQILSQQVYRDATKGGAYPMKPVAQTVVSKMDSPILLTDEAAEFPDVLARYTGLTDDYRKILSHVEGTPAQKSAAVTRLLRDNGVDSALYKNEQEISRVGASPWSHVIFDDSHIELPSNFAEGGSVQPQMSLADYFKANVPVPMLEGEGEALRNRFPQTYGALAGLLGTPPDEMSGSVLEPGYGDRKAGADKTFALGTLLQMLPMAPATKGLPVGAIIRNTGDNNFLKGSVENALAGLKQGPANAAVASLMRAKPGLSIEEAAKFVGVPLEVTPINKFIEGPLTRYVKNQMATPDDPVRALAEQGVLHFDAGITPTAATRAGALRGRAGFAPLGEGKSDLARAWEATSDSNIDAYKAKQFQGDALVDNPWLATKPPETNVYGMDVLNPTATADRLGFTHLTDELRNALNPESGLPRNLLLTPEKLANMGMERAVRHVAAINDWRQAQEVAANAQKANNAATVLHKEYPHTPETPNPKGLRWVELKAPETLPEGYRLEGNNMLSPEGESLGTVRPDYTDEAMGDVLHRYAREHSLTNALKYEGDMMKHCVGGYCDDVLSGQKRIFSLRDAKGEPHVTIHTEPSGPRADPRFDAGVDFEAQAHTDIRRAQPKLDTDSEDYMYAVQGRAQDLAAEWNAKQQAGQPDRIVQIKRKANLVNSEPYEYRPFVQDFVKSGKWSDVGDLPNVGLRPTKEAFNTNELKKIRDAGHEVPEWASPDEINALGNAVWPNQWGKYGNDVGFATGGRVSMIHPAAAIQPLVRVPGFDRF